MDSSAPPPILSHATPAKSHTTTTVLRAIRYFTKDIPLIAALILCIGISFAQTMILRRSQWHQQRLVETLTPLDQHFRVWLNDATQFAHKLGGPTGPGINKTGAAIIMQSVQQQATVLAFLDTFKALMVVTVCFMPLFLLLKRVPTGAGGHGA